MEKEDIGGFLRLLAVVWFARDEMTSESNSEIGK